MQVFHCWTPCSQLSIIKQYSKFAEAVSRVNRQLTFSKQKGLALLLQAVYNTTTYSPSFVSFGRLQHIMMTFQGSHLHAIQADLLWESISTLNLLLSTNGRILVHLNQFLHHALYTAFVLEHQTTIHLCIVKSLLTQSSHQVNF
jgi:hypothetical protein